MFKSRSVLPTGISKVSITGNPTVAASGWRRNSEHMISCCAEDRSANDSGSVSLGSLNRCETVRSAVESKISRLAMNSMKALRQTVDLSAYPDLVVVYLGMTVNMLTGIRTLLGFGPKIEGSVAARPDGLLLHENIFFSLLPLHVGMRQYWRDFESLERFTRADPHREWWKQFLRDTGGTGFWHELYSVRGGFESIYVDVQRPIGFLRFAKVVPAKSGLFSSRERLNRNGQAETSAPYTETDL